jgi:D-sedoheptulose 7-phosphate isomerase
VALNDELADHIAAITLTVEQSAGTVAEIIERLVSCFQGKGKLLLCGNGGSAADSQHLAAEFVNRFHIDRRALPALALSTDASVLTSVANDAAYDRIFARQVEALGAPGDVLIGLSTSGRSANVLAALAAARAQGMTTVGFTGEDGRVRMGALCDVLLTAASRDCARVQECHEFLWHTIAGEVEAIMFGRR